MQKYKKTMTDNKSTNNKKQQPKEDLDDYIFKEQNNKKCSEK